MNLIFKGFSAVEAVNFFDLRIVVDIEDDWLIFVLDLNQVLVEEKPCIVIWCGFDLLVRLFWNDIDAQATIVNERGDVDFSALEEVFCRFPNFEEVLFNLEVADEDLILEVDFTRSN